MKNDKEALEKAEITKLQKIFKDISPDKFATVSGLIQNAAFMVVALKEMQEHLTGYDKMIEVYNHGGGQSGNKISCTLQAYMQLIAKYNQVIKTLVNLLPREGREAARAAADPMADFLTEND